MGGGQAVQVDAQGQAVGTGQSGQGFFQENTVGAKINVLAAVHQFLHQFEDRGIEQGLAPGDGDHRDAAFFHRAQALLQGQGLAQGLPIFLDAAATRAGQVALMGGLQHQDQGELLFPLQPFLYQVAGQIDTET